LVVERQFGYLEFHGQSSSSVKSAGAAVLEAMGVSEKSVLKPEILASKVIDRVDGYHAFLINRSKSGSMLLPGESLYIMEMTTSSYALLVANEAEKAANVKLIDCRFMGPAGRLYLSGNASDVRAAAAVAEAVIRDAGGAAGAQTPCANKSGRRYARLWGRAEPRMTPLRWPP
jgi:hypothetical protein